MSGSDPRRDLAIEVVRTLTRAGHTALWAGGCVRDHLRGHPPDDYDVATSARPDEVRDLFGRRRTLAIGASFGVILVQGPKGRGAGDVEVATFRTEGPYVDGRRPEHVSFATPEEDARRRDFTINGMFYDPLTEALHDFVGGKADLEAGIVRAIGDPHARFTEDKLRMLRAVRMAARFDFVLDTATAQAVRAMAPEILVVSAERITQELKKMLVHVRRAQAMRLADDVRILSVILPELRPLLEGSDASPWRRTLEMLQRLEQPPFELALAALLHELPAGEPRLVDALCRRLRLSNEETERTTWLWAHRAALGGAPGWRPARLKRLLAERHVGPLLTLARVAAECRGGDLRDVEFCENYVATTPPEQINPPPLLTGDDLTALGLTPGPRFKELLDLVREAQLAGELHDRAQAVEYAAKLSG